MKHWLYIPILIAAAPLSAQAPAEPPTGLSIAVLGGGSAFTAFQHGSFEVLAAGPDDGLERREFARRVSAKTAGVFAGTIAYWPNRKWGARLYASYSPSRFQTMVPQADARLMADLNDAAAPETLASLGITAVEAQGLIRLPTIRRKLMPYAILGVGAVRYAADDGPLPDEAADDFASGTRIRPAARFGLGGCLPMRPAGLGLTFELTDQVAGTPVHGDGGKDVKLTNAVSFMVGLNFTFSR